MVPHGVCVVVPWISLSPRIKQRSKGKGNGCLAELWYKRRVHASSKGIKGNGCLAELCV